VKYLEIQEVKGTFIVNARTEAYFKLDFEPVTDADLDTEYTSNEIEIIFPAGMLTTLWVDKGSILINSIDKGQEANVISGDKIAIKAKSSTTKYGEAETVAVTAGYLKKIQVEGSFSITAPNVKCGDVVCVDRVYDLEWQKNIPETHKKWSEAISYCENLEYNSKTDWRLPNINELRTLIINCPNSQFEGECDIYDSENLSVSNGKCNDCTAGAKQYSAIGNEVTEDNFFGIIWSNSTVKNDPDYAFVVSYDAGSVGSVEKNATDTYVFTRCVRGEELLKEGEEPPSQIYQDPDTNFEWMKNAVLNPDPAFPLKYCNDLVLETKDDWRLPTISELRTIVKDDPVLKTGGTCHITDECVAADTCGMTPQCQTSYGGQNVCVFDTANFSFSSTEQANTLSASVLLNSQRLVISFCKSPKGITATNSNVGMIRCVRN
ncbi:MAG TPA: DUF1566 domain-containing protein, partial [bacterium]|nr:DUF1566 domain-containing protein [bacterium]